MTKKRWGSKRPKTFADCQGKPNPCPWVSCKHHMLIDVDPETGSIQFNVGAVRTQERGPGGRGRGYRSQGNLPTLSERDILSKRGKALQEEQDEKILILLQDQKYTCVLKVVQDQVGETLTLDAVGDILSITRERVRQIQVIATDKIKAKPGTFVEHRPC